MLPDSSRISAERLKIPRPLQISPIQKSNPTAFLSRHSTTSTPQTQFSSPRPTGTKSLSTQDTRSLLFEELGSLESQVKELNTKLSENLSCLHEKQLKTLELNETVKRMEFKTCTTDMSYSQDPNCQICLGSCTIG